MEGTILNQDLFEKDIKKTILDSFIKGRDEMVKHADFILSFDYPFSDAEGLVSDIDLFLEDPTQDIKPLYYRLVSCSTNDKVKGALDFMKTRYLNNIETLEKINRMDPEVQIMDEKDLVDISGAFQETLRTVEKMLRELKERLTK